MGRTLTGCESLVSAPSAAAASGPPQSRDEGCCRHEISAPCDPALRFCPSMSQCPAQVAAPAFIRPTSEEDVACSRVLCQALHPEYSQMLTLHGSLQVNFNRCEVTSVMHGRHEGMQQLCSRTYTGQSNHNEGFCTEQVPPVGSLRASQDSSEHAPQALQSHNMLRIQSATTRLMSIGVVRAQGLQSFQA